MPESKGAGLHCLLLFVFAENQQEETLLQNQTQQVQRVRPAQRLLLILVRLGREHPAFCMYSKINLRFSCSRMFESTKVSITGMQNTFFFFFSPLRKTSCQIQSACGKDIPIPWCRESKIMWCGLKWHLVSSSSGALNPKSVFLLQNVCLPSDSRWSSTSFVS